MPRIDFSSEPPEFESDVRFDPDDGDDEDDDFGATEGDSAVPWGVILGIGAAAAATLWLVTREPSETVIVAPAPAVELEED